MRECASEKAGQREGGTAVTPGTSVTVPRDVLERALRKARIEYVRLAQLQGTDAGEEWECWREFENLAEYVDA